MYLRIGVRGEKEKFEHPLTLSLHGKLEEDCQNYCTYIPAAGIDMVASSSAALAREAGAAHPGKLPSHNKPKPSSLAKLLPMQYQCRSPFCT